MTRIALTDLAKIRQHGYKTERFTGRGGGWMLLDSNDAQLMIGDHGGVAPTQWEAVAEALRRIELDERLARGEPSSHVRTRNGGLDECDERLVRDALVAYRSDAEQFADADGASAWHRTTWLGTITRIDALLEKLGVTAATGTALSREQATANRRGNDDEA